ncbi:hypothetical protein JXQ70_17920 [bacterium]|nr:hypothetical protein [bacterium]
MLQKKVIEPAIILVMSGLLLWGGACSSVPHKPYSPAQQYHAPDESSVESDDTPQITYGRSHRFLDASDWFWPESLLSKLLLWNKKVDSHQVSAETVAYIERYLQENGLDKVRVRINDYDVRDEWRRLVRNRDVGGGWRWTAGLFSCIVYTILPGRFFGGDNYNPYTDTINIYSDHPAVVLHEAAHAKDFAERKWKGTYAAAGQIPLVSLYHEAQATGDAIGYLRHTQDNNQEAEAYKILYPAYSTYIGSEIADILDFTRVDHAVIYAVSYGVILPAHLIARIKAHRQRSKYQNALIIEDTYPTVWPDRPELMELVQPQIY